MVTAKKKKKKKRKEKNGDSDWRGIDPKIVPDEGKEPR
jgi:hypothetical protein